MDDDLASNYSIRRWMRHLRTYPDKGIGRLGETIACTIFVLTLIPILLLTLFAWSLMGMKLKPDDPDPLTKDYLWMLWEIGPWYLIPGFSFWLWRCLRCRRLSSA